MVPEKKPRFWDTPVVGEMGQNYDQTSSMKCWGNRVWKCSDICDSVIAAILLDLEAGVAFEGYARLVKQCFRIWDSENIQFIRSCSPHP